MAHNKIAINLWPFNSLLNEKCFQKYCPRSEPEHTIQSYASLSLCPVRMALPNDYFSFVSGAQNRSCRLLYFYFFINLIHIRVFSEVVSRWVFSAVNISSSTFCSQLHKKFEDVLGVRSKQIKEIK